MELSRDAAPVVLALSIAGVFAARLLGLRYCVGRPGDPATRRLRARLEGLAPTRWLVGLGLSATYLFLATLMTWPLYPLLYAGIALLATFPLGFVGPPGRRSRSR